MNFFLERENLEIESINAETLGYNPLYVEIIFMKGIINDLGSRMKKLFKFSTSYKIEQEIKDYINVKVDICFKGKDFKNEFYKKK